MSRDEKIIMVLAIAALVAIVIYGRQRTAPPGVDTSQTNAEADNVPAYLGAAMPMGFMLSAMDYPAPEESLQLQGGAASPSISSNSACGCKGVY